MNNKTSRNILLAALFAAAVIIGVVSSGYTPLNAASKLAAPKIKEYISSQQTITIKWNSVEGADAYRVYMYNSSKKKYKSYKTVDASNGNICEINGLKSGKKYKFKVAALVIKDGDLAVQKKSKVVTVKTKAKQELPLTNVTFYDSDKKAHQLSEYYGEPIIINFWASWCGPCMAEMPEYVDAYKEYGAKVKFLMVNTEDWSSFEYEKSFVKGAGYPFTVFYDLDGEAFSTYQERSAIPTTVAITKSGKIVYQKAGGIDYGRIADIVKMVTED